MTPSFHNFPLTLEHEGHSIQWIDPVEIGHAGPVTGKLLIDKRAVDQGDTRFSGPMLPYRTYMVAPVLVRKLFGSGFAIGLVNLDDLRITVLGKPLDLVVLSKIENGNLFYYTDAKNTTLQAHRLPDPL